jgi:hypothetical protein
LLRYAQQLEDAQRWEEASRAYAQLGQKYSTVNPDFANQFYNRAEWLRQSRSAAMAPMTPAAPGPGTDPTALRGDQRLRPVPQTVDPRTAVPGRSSPVDVPKRRVFSVQSSGPGRLYRAATLIDSQRAYYLVSGQGQIITYATEEPGVNLEPYLGRNVELLGRVLPRGDIRPQYMTVQRALTLP